MNMITFGGGRGIPVIDELWKLFDKTKEVVTRVKAL